MKLTPIQQYIVLGLLAFLGIGFLYYQFLLKPVNREIVALQEKLDQEKKDLESAKQILAKYAEFKKRADSVQRELEWIQNRIPGVIDREKLLEAMNFVQARSSVTLTNFQFLDNSKGAGDYTEVPMNVRFNTSYQGLLNFLYQVGISNLFMITRDLSVSSTNDLTNPNVTLRAQLVVSGIQANK